MRPVLLVSLLLLVPAGQAMSLTLSETDALRPPFEPWDLTARIEVPCDELAAETAADSGQGEFRLEGGAEDIVFTYDPQWDPDVHLFECQGTGPVTREVPLKITPTHDLPAHEPKQVPVAVRLGDLEAKAEAAITSEWDSIFEARAPMRLAESHPGGVIEFPIEVTNYGNAPISVAFTAPEISPDRLVLPEPLHLAQGGQEGASGQTVVRFESADGSGWENRQQIVELTLTPMTEWGDEGEPIEITLLGRTRTDIPGTPLPVLAVGLVALAVLRRHRA